MEQTLSNMSIADLKAALDYVGGLKSERLAELREQDEDTKNDEEINTYSQIEFDLNQALFKRIMKLKRDY